MKTLILAAAVLASAPVAAATYLPTGPQANVALATVTGGGWTLCYSAPMATIFGSSAATALAGCTGTQILLAGRETGSDTLLSLAQTTKLDALTDTGAADNNIFTLSNGSDWFNADNWSWGFKTPGSAYEKFECGSGAGSMCLHTLSFVGGYSINDIFGLNNSTDYEKLVFTDSVVPEPATWAMLITGFGLVGFAARRRKALAA